MLTPKVRTPTSAAAGSGRPFSPMSPAVRLTTKTSAVASSSVNGTSDAASSKPVTSSATSSRPTSARVGATTNSVLSTPKVPQLRLGTPQVSPSITRGGAMDLSRFSSTRKPLRTHIVTNPSATSSKVFLPADPVKALPPSAFHTKHTHSNPFDGVRQHTFPASAKRVSIPRPQSASAVATGSDETPHPHRRKQIVPGPTDPIVQVDEAATQRATRAKSPATATRGHGVCAPVAKPVAEFPLKWDDERTPNSAGVSATPKRCRSAPATVRGMSQESSHRPCISTKSTLRNETLKGVWVPEVKPVKVMALRAPYAQTTPRSVTPPPSSVRKAVPLVTPYWVQTSSSNTAPPSAATGSTASRRGSLVSPYHTSTPRGPSPGPSTYRPSAPYHTTTPRGPKPDAAKATPLKSILN